MFSNLAHSSIGWIHVVASVAAVVFGTQVLVSKKGTRAHQRTGYIYAASMIVVNLTAFLIYRLFGGFGPFHIAAVVSSLTLLAGMVPILMRARFKNWFVLHMSFMYYSVIGLYAALASEIIVRIPGIRFWWSVMGATMQVMLIGILAFNRQMKKWQAQFGKL